MQDICELTLEDFSVFQTFDLMHVFPRVEYGKCRVNLHFTCVLSTNEKNKKHAKLTKSLKVCCCGVRVVQLVEEALYHVRPVGSGVQTELPSRTQAVLVHLPREDERVFHQRHHLQAVSLDRKPRSPASSSFTISLAVPSPHAGTETLSRAAPEPPDQPQDPSFQLQPASGPLADSDPGGLAKSAPLQAPNVEQLGGQDPGEAGIHLDQARGSGERGVGEKPPKTEG